MNWAGTGVPLHLPHHVTQEGFPDYPHPLFIQRGELWLAHSPASGTDAFCLCDARCFFASTFMSDHFFFFFTSSNTVSTKQYSFPLFHLPDKNFYLTLGETALLRLSLCFWHAFSHEWILIGGVSLNIHRWLWAWYDPHTGAPHLEWIVIYKRKWE